jgi:N4-gp56 family major capsid protein
MRRTLQPLTKFRQFLDAKDDALSLHAGDTYYWNVYQNLQKRGTRLTETSPIPETSFKTLRRSLTIGEFGNSVPYTGKLEALAEHDIKTIINQTFIDDARKSFDYEVFAVMKQTPLRVAPTGGNSATAVTLTTNSATATTNNAAMTNDHVKAIVDTMKERNIAPYMNDDYFCITRPKALRTFKNNLEAIVKYVDMGVQKIMAGEIGRYEGCRFIEQTNIPEGGANDSTTFDPLSDTADAWNNGLSSWAFFFGKDVGAEALVIPEEVRAGIPSDFGRSKKLAWYSMTGFGLSHPDAANARIVMWDSAA